MNSVAGVCLDPLEAWTAHPRILVQDLHLFLKFLAHADARIHSPLARLVRTALARKILMKCFSKLPPTTVVTSSDPLDNLPFILTIVNNNTTTRFPIAQNRLHLNILSIPTRNYILTLVHGGLHPFLTLTLIRRVLALQAPV
jgi:hypothetical protein